MTRAAGAARDDAPDIAAREVRKVLLLRFTWSIILLQAVMTPYFVDKGLDLRDVFLLQSFFAFALLVLELPTGILSDVVGRRSVLVGAALARGLGATALVLLEGFWGMAAAYALLALGNSALSGSDVSALVDRYKAGGRTDRSLDFYLGRLRMLSLVAAAGSAAIGGVLASGSLLVAGVANCAIAWLALPVALSISPDAVRAAGGGAAAPPAAMAVLRGAVAMMRANPILRLSLLAAAAFTLYTTATTYAFQMRWLELGLDPAWMGVAFAARSIVAAVAATAMVGVVARFGAARALRAGGLVAAAALLLAVPPQLGTSLAAMILLATTDGVASVLLLTRVNALVTTEVRATANSTVNFLNRGLMIGFGPILGAAAAREGAGGAFAILAALAVAVLIGLVLPLARRLRDEPPRAASR
jgi:hypothetical protein